MRGTHVNGSAGVSGARPINRMLDRDAERPGRGGAPMSAECPPLRRRCAGRSGVEIGLAGGAGDEGGDDVGGVAVERDPGTVVAHSGATIGVAGCLLDVT